MTVLISFVYLFYFLISLEFRSDQGMLFYYFYLMRQTGGVINSDDTDHEILHFIGCCAIYIHYIVIREEMCFHVNYEKKILKYLN